MKTNFGDLDGKSAVCYDDFLHRDKLFVDYDREEKPKIKRVVKRRFFTVKQKREDYRDIYVCFGVLAMFLVYCYAIRV